MGLWYGWPSWALSERSGRKDTPSAWMSRSDHTWAVASIDLGHLLSAWPAGWLVGRIGHRGCMLVVGTTLITSFGTLFAPGRWAVFVACSLSGVCETVVHVTVPSFLAEISTDNMRGRLNVATAAFDSLGMLVAMTLGPRVPYAVMNSLALATALAFLVAVIRVPETPTYLLSRGQQDEAGQAFRWYRPGVTEARRNELLVQLNESVQEEMRDPGTYRELLVNDGNRVALLLVVGAYFAQYAGGISSVIMYSTTTLPTDGPIRPDNVATIFAAVRLGFTLTTAPLIDRFGRRPLLIGSHVGLAAVTAAYAGCLYYDDDDDGLGASSAITIVADWAACACVILFTVAYSMGADIVPAVLLGEMFPTNVKARAVGVVAVVSSLGSFFTDMIYLPVSDTFGVHFMYLGFCVINAVWAVCAHLFLFETKGLSLSAIQEILNSYNRSSSRKDEGPLPPSPSEPSPPVDPLPAKMCSEHHRSSL